MYYKNIHNMFPVYLERLSPSYNNGTAHNHNMRHQALRLLKTKTNNYVQSTKYKFFKLIREPSQKDLDRRLTLSMMQFVAYFKYKMIVIQSSVQHN